MLIEDFFSSVNLLNFLGKEEFASTGNLVKALETPKKLFILIVACSSLILQILFRLLKIYFSPMKDEPREHTW